MALRSKELKKSAEDCGCETVSERLEDEDGTRTASAAVTSVSQRSTSFWRAVTSSTEHFFEATRATLDSSLRASRARCSPGSGNTGAEALRRRSLGKSSSMSGGRGLVGLLLGVLEPLLKPLKSNRMRRTVPRVNCSRQKGQTGDKRDDVFSRMLLQQLKHNTCPERGERGMSENFPEAK
jgi:hypothetical protein